MSFHVKIENVTLNDNNLSVPTTGAIVDKDTDKHILAFSNKNRRKLYSENFKTDKITFLKTIYVPIEKFNFKYEEKRKQKFKELKEGISTHITVMIALDYKIDINDNDVFEKIKALAENFINNPNDYMTKYEIENGY